MMIHLKKHIDFTGMYRKACLDLQNWKQYRNRQELWLKVKNDQEQHEKTIIELKGRAV